MVLATIYSQEGQRWIGQSWDWEGARSGGGGTHIFAAAVVVVNRVLFQQRAAKTKEKRHFVNEKGEHADTTSYKAK